MSINESLQELVHSHYDRLFRAALFMCGSPEAAEDLVQETFLAAVTSLPSFQGRSSSYTWLYGVMLNKFKGWLRQKGGPISLQQIAEESDLAGASELLAADEPGAHEQVVRRETAQIVREALDELPHHHRSVLALRYLEGMSYREIAESLGCSLGTVKSRIHYALRKVAGKLEHRRGLAP